MVAGETPNRCRSSAAGRTPRLSWSEMALIVKRFYTQA